MKLHNLLSPWLNQLPKDCDITGITHDSRKVKSGDLFLAYPGHQVDGRQYIQQAIDKGACAILYEAEHNTELFLEQVNPSAAVLVPFIGLEKHLATLAARFYGQPAQYLQFTGVTGTNGKTTIAYQLAQAYTLLSESSVYIGTLGQGKTNQLQTLHNTTPDGLILQGLLHDYVTQGVRQVCMEVSSHALAQQRVAEIPFQQAIFTNLTHDHLDYHQTMEAYAEAKAKLFATPSLRYAIINQDDPYAKLMLQRLPSSCEAYTYGIDKSAMIQAYDWNVSLQGTRIHMHTPWGDQLLQIRALGYFNIYNALAIFTSLAVAGYEISQIITIMAELKPAPGRMEVVSQSPTVIVDYAHTPDALENVLRTLRPLKQGKLMVVFGCGGDRDRLKRPIMGKIAVDYADQVIVTSDNPRHEDPQQIIQDILHGIGAEQISKVHTIIEREPAIRYALANAEPADIILIAGKGHESYQQIGDEIIPFSDQAIVHACHG